MRIRSPLATVLLAACSGHADTSTVDPIGPTPIEVMPASTKVMRVTNLIAQAPQRDAQNREAPWSLTASDGNGLALTRVDGKAVVEGPLAFTELHLYFHNPEDRRREGTFSITLPQGAVVSRFAMENEGQLQEAEVVEKQLARRAYEDFLHRRQDPALLEKAEGNQFSARVFPILPKADKHVVISFSQQVTPGHYALPLRGLAKVDQVDIRVDMRGKDGGMVEQTIAERNWLPDRDVVVDGSTVGAPDSVVAGELVAARVKLELPQAAEPPTGVTILVDTSASRALGFDALIKSVRQLVGDLGRDYGALPIQIVAFDQTTQSIFDGRADKPGDIESAFAARGALGASDLGQALAWLGDNKPLSRVLIVTDGVVTAGASGDDLAKLAKGIKGVERIDVALAGGIRDEQTAGAVAHAGLAHAGAVLDLDKGTTEVAHRMGLAVKTDVPIAIDGARWVFPHAIAAAQSGDEITVFARRDVQHKLTVAIAGMRVPLSPVA
ncbi:MAG TPA: VIT domain-containing protein, partial [Gemmatimonadaceae bacterium]|nr:VIT domain-containing protein [Gemmatimonadaceae bacterium]